MTAEAATMPAIATVETEQTTESRNRLVIYLLLVSTFVVILNETLMIVALPRLMTDLGVSAGRGQRAAGGARKLVDRFDVVFDRQAGHWRSSVWCWAF